jgi:asparagine synthase (glutamine-hydrolysing)
VSGIAAVFARVGRPGRGADPTLLARLVAALRFRGPDGEGAWSSGPIGLLHTLHATTVEAARERSPAALDDRLVIAADARLDARDELRAALRAAGREIAADATDPDLILHAYDVWGEDCLPRLLGDYSFALWDAARRRLVCAVDALGARAFYYADRGGLFLGGNTLACVRLHPDVRDALDERAAADFILFGHYLDRDVTIDADVARVPPGHSLVVDDDGARLRPFFRWPELEATRRGDVVEELRELLGRAVRDRLRTPRVSVLMSGGVDSSLVALTAKRELPRGPGASLRAYTAVYDHLVPDDEGRWARLVAESLQIPLELQPVDDGGVFDWVGRLSPPEPTAGAGLAPVLAQLARMTAESPVVLTGYDGDTLVRASFRSHFARQLAAGHVASFGRDLAWYLARTRSLPPLGLRTAVAARRARAAIRRPPWLRVEPWDRLGLAARWERSLGVGIGSSAHPRAPALRSLAAPVWGAFFDAHDPGYLGRPVEFRHPLLDLRIVRFMLSLAAVPWCVDKRLLRLGLDGLPAAVRRRPKTPLAVDPFAPMIRRLRTGAAPAPRPSQELAPWVDVGEISRALFERGDQGDPWPMVRALALGAWLDLRAGRTPREVLGAS